jgi:predicted RNase H-like HicB family nuclease
VPFGSSPTLRGRLLLRSGESALATGGQTLFKVGEGAKRADTKLNREIATKMLSDSQRSCKRKGLEMSVRRYPVVIEPTPTGYSAFSPDVPGCAAVGDTEEETRLNFQDALASHLEAMREIGEPIPEPRASVNYVEVAA